VRFLFLSNFSYFGRDATLQLSVERYEKKIVLQEIGRLVFPSNLCCLCSNFRAVLGKISWRHKRYKKATFVYADPPYVSTGYTYQNGFTEQDAADLFNILTTSGMRFAISEFDNPFIVSLAKEHNLHISELGERRNLKNRAREILITNYKAENSLF